MGWQQAGESEPHLINHDLIAALASLSPGEAHELHAPSDTHPGIMVHTAIVHEEENGSGDGDEAGKKARVEIAATRCPERT